MKKKAFTLIELLVVIAIIALLLAILMPTLRRAKEAGKRIHCLNNVKTLSLSMIMYTNDYNGVLPKADRAPDGWIQRVAGYGGLNIINAPKELQIEALTKGLLYPYVENPDVYRCPVAERNEYSTYSITHALNGFASQGGTILSKITKVKSSDSRIMFLDDYLIDYDACWMIYNNQTKWWNTTPIRHGSGGNVFSFVDGHSDFQIWKDKRTIDLAERCYEEGISEDLSAPAQPGNVDIIWAQKATWGTLAYTP